MDARLLCFRFDIDSPKCLDVGVPRLLTLARGAGAKFTFFVNCGRSIDFKLSARALLARHAPTEGAPQLSARRKLGLGGYLHWR